MAAELLLCVANGPDLHHMLLRCVASRVGAGAAGPETLDWNPVSCRHRAETECWHVRRELGVVCKIVHRLQITRKQMWKLLSYRGLCLSNVHTR